VTFIIAKIRGGLIKYKQNRELLCQCVIKREEQQVGKFFYTIFLQGRWNDNIDKFVNH
jgi:hypothetical protein